MRWERRHGGRWWGVSSAEGVRLSELDIWYIELQYKGQGEAGGWGTGVCVCEKTHDWHVDIILLWPRIYFRFSNWIRLNVYCHTTSLYNLPGDLMDCGKLKPKHGLAHEHCQSLRLWRLGLSITVTDFRDFTVPYISLHYKAPFYKKF